MIVSATDLQPGDYLAFESVPGAVPHHIRPVLIPRGHHREESAWHPWGSVIRTDPAVRRIPLGERHSEPVVWAWCGFGASSIVVGVHAGDQVLIRRTNPSPPDSHSPVE
jgi:hypothetical protein